MSKGARRKSTSKGYPVKVGNTYVSWYSYGCMLAETGSPMPPIETIHPHMLQGYNKTRRQMKEFRLRVEVRAFLLGRFDFLPQYLDAMLPVIEAYVEQFGHTLEV